MGKHLCLFHMFRSSWIGDYSTVCCHNRTQGYTIQFMFKTSLSIYAYASLYIWWSKTID